jgi:FMN phosphatase YigB (HAD superfamily)
LDRALRSINVTRREAVFVGDTLETDAAAARALGMPCILIGTHAGELASHIDDSVSFVPPTFPDIYAELIRLLNASE